MLLSIVVVTGYAGQLSLAQYAMAGFGAVAGRLVAVYQLPFLLGFIAGVVAGAAGNDFHSSGGAYPWHQSCDRDIGSWNNAGVDVVQ